VCFANAEIVRRCGLQRDLLRWPNAREPVTPRDDDREELAALHAESLEDSRLYAELVAQRAERDFERGVEGRQDALREMSDAEDEEITKVEGGRGRA
jgi:hypothetical protein